MFGGGEKMGIMWSSITCPLCSRTWTGEFSYNPREPTTPPAYVLCSICEKYIKKVLKTIASKIKNSGIFKDIEEWITKVPQEHWSKKAMDIINNSSEIIHAEFRKVDLDVSGERPEASIVFYVKVKTQKGIIPAYLSVNYVYKGKVRGLIAIGKGFKFNGVKMSLI